MMEFSGEEVGQADTSARLSGGATRLQYMLRIWIEAA
ncbi:hypothetical protein PVOR_15384 [Paenibacillus vortex V453]|uniref:Uncharacterized protein n=1 Tax=Paenibacillus vortex V453 TaxID=715225 RepID=A0A2R9SUI7_9BACL|nr:hypothetical protein PVOR_15384 [Paenibacillus vortex V453]